MAHIPDSELKKLLRHLPPHEQQALGDVIANRVKQRVKCLSDTCKGRVIAELFEGNGKVRYRATIDEGRLWMVSYRPRLDGVYGFQCLCGNDSRLAPVEKGVKGIEMNAIRRQDLEEVYERRKYSEAYPITDKGQEVDGFLLEDV